MTSDAEKGSKTMLETRAVSSHLAFTGRTRFHLHTHSIAKKYFHGSL